MLKSLSRYLKIFANICSSDITVFKSKPSPCVQLSEKEARGSRKKVINSGVTEEVLVSGGAAGGDVQTQIRMLCTEHKR
jgi:hypothetical protein